MTGETDAALVKAECRTCRFWEKYTNGLMCGACQAPLPPMDAGDHRVWRRPTNPDYGCVLHRPRAYERAQEPQTERLVWREVRPNRWEAEGAFVRRVKNSANLYCWEAVFSDGRTCRQDTCEEAKSYAEEHLARLAAVPAPPSDAQPQITEGEVIGAALDWIRYLEEEISIWRADLPNDRRLSCSEERLQRYGHVRRKPACIEAAAAVRGK